MSLNILISMVLIFGIGSIDYIHAAPQSLATLLGNRTLLCKTDLDPKVNSESTIRFYKNARLELKAEAQGEASIKSDEFGYGSDSVLDSAVGEFVMVNFGDDGRHVLILNSEDLEVLGQDEETIAGDLLGYGHFRPEVGIGTRVIRVNCGLKK